MGSLIFSQEKIDKQVFLPWNVDYGLQKVLIMMLWKSNSREIFNILTKVKVKLIGFSDYCDHFLH